MVGTVHLGKSVRAYTTITIFRLRFSPYFNIFYIILKDTKESNKIISLNFLLLSNSDNIEKAK